VRHRSIAYAWVLVSVLWWSCGHVVGEDFSNVGSFNELLTSARLLAMGNSGIALPGGECAVAPNPAALAWNQGLTLASSYENRPDTYDCVDISATSKGAALALQYFDFGDILETDADGNVLGITTYQAGTVAVAVGLRGGAIARFGEWGMGATAKLLTARYSADSGREVGLSLGVGFLAVGDGGQFESNFLTGYSFAVTLTDIPVTGIRLSGGNSEWSYPKLAVGAALEIIGHLAVTMDSVVGDGVRFGMEWDPILPFALRAGLRYEGVPMWSFGAGVRLDTVSLDYALVSNPYVAWQHRITIGWSWAGLRH
jgi:hypothetical protein